jgi:hypothetical protein
MFDPQRAKIIIYDFAEILSIHGQSGLSTICFTICLFISPDLDGSRALKTSLTYGHFIHNDYNGGGLRGLGAAVIVLLSVLGSDCPIRKVREAGAPEQITRFQRPAEGTRELFWTCGRSSSECKVGGGKLLPATVWAGKGFGREGAQTVYKGLPWTTTTSA